MKRLENDTYSVFNSAFTNLLNAHVPLKTETLRYNNKTFITKEIRKEIMKKYKLKYLFNKKKNKGNWCYFKIQRNYHVDPLYKIKKQSFKLKAKLRKFRYQKSHRK